MLRGAAQFTHELSWEAVGQMMLMLALIWWMYSGYAWLTNAVSTRGVPRRAVLLGGMGGRLIIALAIPGAFHGSGLVFGLAGRIKRGTGHAYDSLTDGQALALGDGVALFLAADVAFRRVLCLGRSPIAPPPPSSPSPRSPSAPRSRPPPNSPPWPLLLTAARAGESALRPERYAASH